MPLDILLQCNDSNPKILSSLSTYLEKKIRDFVPDVQLVSAVTSLHSDLTDPMNLNEKTLINTVDTIRPLSGSGI